MLCVRSTRFLLFLAGLVFMLAACGGSEPVEAQPRPDNVLSIVITDNGKVEAPIQEIFTNKPSVLLRLSILSRGGNAVKDGKMFRKVVTVVNVSRTDKTSNMGLGSVIMTRLDSNLYGGDMDLQLPTGTYGLTIDGTRVKGVIFRVSPTPFE